MVFADCLCALYRGIYVSSKCVVDFSLKAAISISIVMSNYAAVKSLLVSMYMPVSMSVGRYRRYLGEGERLVGNLVWAAAALAGSQT